MVEEPFEKGDILEFIPYEFQDLYYTISVIYVDHENKKLQGKILSINRESLGFKLGVKLNLAYNRFKLKYKNNNNTKLIW